MIDLHGIFDNIEYDIQHMQKIVAKVLFDNATFVTTANDEIIDTLMRIGL
jgi:hypothetical protein